MTTSYDSQRSEVQKLYDAEVMKRVKNGIDLLFEKYGPGWVDKIDMDTLDLQSGSACVLGQVYAEHAEAAGGDEGYYYALGKLELEDDGYQYGFCTLEYSDNWGELQEAWEDALRPLKRLPL